MKIGVITFCETQENYGQVLQCFALIRFLRLMGHEAFLIKYATQRHRSKILRVLAFVYRYLFKSKYRRNIQNLWKQSGKISIKVAYQSLRKFDDFRTHYIPSTNNIYNEQSLIKQPPIADAYICGSDQIWSSPSSAFFLQFGGDDIKRIAYAPSLGGVQPKGEWRETMKTYLKRFDYISSREKNGVRILQEMGFTQAVMQPDPTLLLKAEEYRNLEAHIKNDKTQPYILLYLLGNETDVDVQDVFNFAHTHNMDLRYVASQGRTDDFPKLYPTIEEWLGLIDQASFIVTNSFHGTVFCLQFNKPFLVLPVKGSFSRMNNRIYDLLEKYRLMDRIYNGSLDKLFSKIDFSLFNQIREKEADNVQVALTNILKSNKES